MRFAALVLAVTTVLAAFRTANAGEPGAIVLRVQAFGCGTPGVAKEGRWMPLRAEVVFTPKNSAETLDGELVFLPGTGLDRTPHAALLRMGPGTKAIELYCIADKSHLTRDGYEGTLQIWSRGRLAYESSFLIPGAAVVNPAVRIVVCIGVTLFPGLPGMLLLPEGKNGAPTPAVLT